MADATPFWFPGDSFTGLTNAAVTGQTFADAVVNQTDGHPIVAPCANGIRGVGVFGFDQVAGDTVTIYTKGIMPVVAGAAITTGQEVQSNATGQAIPVAGGRPMGKAVADCAAGAVAQILLQI